MVEGTDEQGTGGKKSERNLSGNIALRFSFFNRFINFQNVMADRFEQKHIRDVFVVFAVLTINEVLGTLDSRLATTVHQFFITAWTKHLSSPYFRFSTSQIFSS
ncbi:MAG: hypothetical protein ACR2OW_02360, partial [Methyloligellaceae bacterium]